MTTKIEWIFLVVVLLISPWGSVQTVGAYEYEETPHRYWDWDPPINNESATAEEDAEATASATVGGTVSCYATAYTWAKDGDGATADISSYASWGLSWEWNGPPATAPGGTLSWEHDADGSATANGENTVGSGEALSAAGASSETSSSSPGSSSWATGNAEASVYDNATATGEASADGSPTPDVYPTENPGTGRYYYSVTWDSFADGTEAILDGTSYVSFSGGVSCYCWSGAGAGPHAIGAEAWADATSHGGGGLEASFP